MGQFTSTEDMGDAIKSFLKVLNYEGKPYRWNKPAERFAAIVLAPSHLSL
jgi:hypothetical protein